MKITQALLDKLTEEAKASPSLRMNYDLRNSEDDKSQRMLNAIEPGSVLPIHRHQKSSETVVCLRGHLRELFYNDKKYTVNDFKIGPTAQRLYDELTGIQWGKRPDPFGWTECV